MGETVRVRSPYAPDLAALRIEIEAEVPEQFHPAIRQWFEWWESAQWWEFSVYNNEIAPSNTAPADPLD
jgi:hypothetical protein